MIEDEIAPSYLRAKRFTLSLAAGQATPRAFAPVVVDVSYAAAAPEGASLPLVFEIRGPSAESVQRREFLSVRPTQLTFVPREGGAHLVVLREAAHNLWFGSLRVDIAGETLTQPSAV